MASGRVKSVTKKESILDSDEILRFRKQIGWVMRWKFYLFKRLYDIPCPVWGMLFMQGLIKDYNLMCSYFGRLCKSVSRPRHNLIIGL